MKWQGHSGRSGRGPYRKKGNASKCVLKRIRIRSLLILNYTTSWAMTWAYNWTKPEPAAGGAQTQSVLSAASAKSVQAVMSKYSDFIFISSFHFS